MSGVWHKNCIMRQKPLYWKRKGVVCLRVLLIALNAKYVHTNLAVRYLREAVRSEFPGTGLKEFTINEPLGRIAGEVFEAKADIIGFSCYIWNIAAVLALIRRLRPVCPQARFVLGGPEVSFEAAALLREHPEVDAIVAGEGEETFLQLLRAWRDGQDLSLVAGLVWRHGKDVCANPPRLPAPDLAGLPLPYAADEDLRGRLVYVETTRGCPFDCQYCLSSTFQGVRYLSPERFREIFRRLLALGARTIKFVDRTFNVSKEHARAILTIVREEAARCQEEIRVHCEIAGELLDQEWVEYLLQLPPGLVQLEIGVQSTYPPALRAINRRQDFGRWAAYLRQLQAAGGVPLHLDLIAGLPAEDWQHFRNSFNDVYSVRPDRLQLGFLKLLKGSGLRRDAARYGLVYSPDPPYQILATDRLTHAELLRLELIEELVERYYNSGRFGHSLEGAAALFPSPFDFYEAFAAHLRANGWFTRSWRAKELFVHLWEFLTVRASQLGLAAERLELLRDLLRFDYYLWERPAVLPEFLASPYDVWMEVCRERAFALGLGQDQEGGADRRRWARATAIAAFTHDVAAKRRGAVLGHDAVPDSRPGDISLSNGDACGALGAKCGAGPGPAEPEAVLRAAPWRSGAAARQPGHPSRGIWYLFVYSKQRTRVLRVPTEQS